VEKIGTVRRKGEGEERKINTGKEEKRRKERKMGETVENGAKERVQIKIAKEWKKEIS
jgi:hypothetical protein